MPRRVPTVALAVLALCTSGVAMAATTAPATVAVYGTPAANRDQARRAANALLAALGTPAGTRRGADSSPLLDEPGYEEATPNLVDARRFLITTLSPAAVIAAVAGHLPPGVIPHDGDVQPGPTVSERDWELAPAAGLVQRIVAVTADPLAAGRTLVRLDGEAVWLSPRPSASRIAPATVTGASFSGHGTLTDGRPAPRSRTVDLDAAAARAVTAALNRDALVQPGFRSCPYASGESITLQLHSTRDRPLARAVEVPGGCPTVALAIAGGPSAMLTDGAPAGPSLAGALVSAHAMHRCAADQLAGAPGHGVRNRSRRICALRGGAIPRLLFPGTESNTFGAR